MKAAIKNLCGRLIEASRVSTTTKHRALMSEAAGQLMNIGPKWVSVEGTHPTDESLMYWVLFPSGSIGIMYFNQYSAQLTNYNKWQDLGNNDLSMRGTKYIKIEQPEPPAQ